MQCLQSHLAAMLNFSRNMAVYCSEFFLFPPPHCLRFSCCFWFNMQFIFFFLKTSVTLLICKHIPRLGITRKPMGIHVLMVNRVLWELPFYFWITFITITACNCTDLCVLQCYTFGKKANLGTEVHDLNNIVLQEAAIAWFQILTSTCCIPRRIFPYLFPGRSAGHISHIGGKYLWTPS